MDQTDVKGDIEEVEVRNGINNNEEAEPDTDTSDDDEGQAEDTE